MELARALTQRRKQGGEISGATPTRATSMRSRYGTVRHSAISSPLELVSTTNPLVYSAPNIYGSSDESDTSATLSGSSRATTPETEAPSPVEPNHLSTYFSSTGNMSARRSKDSSDNESPLIPKRMPSHTKKSHQAAAARKRGESQTLQQPPNDIHNIAPIISHTVSDTLTSKTEGHHPFGAELAQVNDVAKGFGAQNATIMEEEEEQYLMTHGLCKFGADEYIDEVQGLFGGIYNNPFSSFSQAWI